MYVQWFGYHWQFFLTTVRVINWLLREAPTEAALALLGSPLLATFFSAAGLWPGVASPMFLFYLFTGSVFLVFIIPWSEGIRRAGRKSKHSSPGKNLFKFPIHPSLCSLVLEIASVVPSVFSSLPRLQWCQLTGLAWPWHFLEGSHQSSNAGSPDSPF